jgi:hypothetical protein
VPEHIGFGGAQMDGHDKWLELNHFEVAHAQQTVDCVGFGALTLHHQLAYAKQAGSRNPHHRTDQTGK